MPHSRMQTQIHGLAKSSKSCAVRRADISRRMSPGTVFMYACMHCYVHVFIKIFYVFACSIVMLFRVLA